MRRALALGLLFGGCFSLPSEFVCARDGECVSAHAAGRCLAAHCAFPDPACPSGLRFADHSGAVSGQCADLTDGGTD